MLRLTVRKFQTTSVARQSGIKLTIRSLSTEPEPSKATSPPSAPAGSVDSIKAFFAEHQVTVKGVHPELYAPLVKFEEVPFVSKIMNVLKKEDFTKPSPIQALSWPIALDKKDIISVAKTGSGKKSDT